MLVLAIICSGFLVVAIGLVFVGWAVNKTTKMPDQIVIDSDQALEYCAQALPQEVTATLSYEELYRALRIHLEWIQAFHWSPENNSPKPIVFDKYEPIDYVTERAKVLRLEITQQQISQIIDAHTDYLQAQGAIGVANKELAKADLQAKPELDSERDEIL